MDDVITNQPVVIDNGSGMIKAGFAGDPSPKCKFYNYSGRPKHTRCMAGALEGDVFIGKSKMLRNERIDVFKISNGTWNCYRLE
uniref:Actin n=1 Tax=Panagrolaimus davidi TaxID=227884 RepID=A0A914P0T4_9BILA